eukprot:GGOE01033271.1.p1 GENE.GGOE01033271.1~~GGOE01033271.1.p1  ORF type:complete len:1238 (-),score=338.86 GGOE01033271.1:1562-4912(-)
MKDKSLTPRKSTLEMKIGKLEAAFIAQAVNGHITIDQLPAFLAAAEINKTEQRMHEVIAKVISDASNPDTKVDLAKATEICRLLAEDEEASLAPRGKRMNCCAQWADKMSDTAATNVLLTIVVGVSFVSAFLVAGLAILLMWQYSVDTLNSHMREDLGTMRDIMQVFDENIFSAEINSRVQDLTSILAAVTDYVSYKSVLENDKKNLEYMATFLAQGVSAWWLYQPGTAYMDIAKVVALWLESAVSHNGRPAALEMVDAMLSTLPDGYEILIGEWSNASNMSVTFLTDFRFKSQCTGACGSDTSTTSISPMKVALGGVDGALRGFDYRPKEVLVGYTSIIGMGVEYKADVSVITDAKYERVKEFFDTQNANALDSREFIIGRIVNGSIQLLTKLRSCDSSCVAHVVRPVGPLAHALQGQRGTMELVSYFGKPVIAAYCPIPNTTLGLVVQMLKEERVEAILTEAASVADYINANLTSGSEELELSAMMTVNSTQKLQHLTHYRFPCPNGTCPNRTTYVKAAMANCSSGVMKTTDYRNVSVIVGYYCIQDLGAYLSLKVDVEETEEEFLTYAVQLVDERNAKDVGSSDEFLLARRKTGVTNVETFSDIQLLTKLKEPEKCLSPNCTWNSHTLLRALKNVAGDLPANMAGVNYAGVDVSAAVDYAPNLAGGLGLVMEKKTADFMSPIISTALDLVYFTLGAVIFSTAVLILFTKRMMRSMITASLEGKKAIEREKQQFQALVASMYPAYVVPRLLAGERHIVEHVKHTAVFFSDIYEFTSASNTISSEELITFMGYTYGVMDEIAQRYNVYKVKTVGDAYLAIAGLPGSGSTEPCMDMLYFASVVAQVFSHRFNHPEKGKILALVGDTMSWNKKNRRLPKGGKGLGQKSGSGLKASIAPPGSTLDGAPSAWGGRTATEAESTHPSVISGGSKAGKSVSVAGSRMSRGPAVPQVQCIMSYGIATGAVTAGVLQGKSPMFDIWGKTVNLASRMESTGQAGRIQVVEGVFQAVVAQNDQPFLFDSRHKVFCKGFGSVNAYFVAACSTSPPKELLAALHIEPNLGAFFFDNPVPEYRPRVKGGVLSSGKSGSQRSSSVGQQSAQSSATSNVAANVRGPAQLA